MAKGKKNKTSNIPDGMKCYQKMGGGSHRFPNRIIKPGQKFWTYPALISEAFADVLKEVPDDFGAIVVGADADIKFDGKKEKVVDLVPDKFEMVKAVDEDGNPIKKGNANLYNIVGEDGKPLNEKPLRKGKATELLEAVSV